MANAVAASRNTFPRTTLGISGVTNAIAADALALVVARVRIVAVAPTIAARAVLRACTVLIGFTDVVATCGIAFPGARNLVVRVAHAVVARAVLRA